MKTEIRSTGSLKRHPLHKAKVAAPDKTSPEWAAFAETIRADGRIRDAVKITEDGLVMDGWWRVEAACDLCLDVPCEINDAGEAALLIVESLTARKQMSRGATVYLALGMLQEYADAAERRRLRNVSARRSTAEQQLNLKSTFHEPSQRYLAERWGVTQPTIAQAQKVRALLHDPKNFEIWCRKNEIVIDSANKTQEVLRAEFEPLLFNGEKSLWKILQAVAGRLTTEGLPKRGEQLELFSDRFTDFITTALRLPDMKAARSVIEEALEQMPDVGSLHRVVEIATEMAKHAQARAQALTKKKAA
jgi:hypothetical protein